MRRICLALLCLLIAGPPFAAEEIRMIAFNIERGWKSEAELATVLNIMDDIGSADIWALSEANHCWLCR